MNKWKVRIIYFLDWFFQALFVLGYLASAGLALYAVIFSHDYAQATLGVALIILANQFLDDRRNK